MERTVFELELRAVRLEQERDEAMEAESNGRRPYMEMEEKYWKEKAAHKETKEDIIIERIRSFILLVLLIGAVLLWWFVLR